MGRGWGRGLGRAIRSRIVLASDCFFWGFFVCCFGFRRLGFIFGGRFGVVRVTVTVGFLGCLVCLTGLVGAVVIVVLATFRFWCCFACGIFGFAYRLFGSGFG